MSVSSRTLATSSSRMPIARQVMCAAPRPGGESLRSGCVENGGSDAARKILGPQVDALEVEVTERLQGSRRGLGHPDPPGLFDCCEYGVDEHADLLRPSGPHDVAHGLGQVVGDKDAGAHRVFEVVAHVGDAI